MLVENKFKILLDLVNNSTHEELIWMNGYLNGIVKNKTVQQEVVAESAAKKITRSEERRVGKECCR